MKKLGHIVKKSKRHNLIMKYLMKSVNAGKGEQNAEYGRGFYWLFKLLGTFLGVLLEIKCQNQS